MLSKKGRGEGAVMDFELGQEHRVIALPAVSVEKETRPVAGASEIEAYS